MIDIKKISWQALWAFTPIAVVAIWLNQRNFAIGDDYHAFGFYFILNGMDFSTAVLAYWKSPFMAGRPFAAITELFPLSLIHSINQLVWVRYLHLVIFVIIFYLFWTIIKKNKHSSLLASWLALLMLTMPGVWHMYLMNYGTPMLLGICATLLGALLTTNNSNLSIKQWLMFSAWAFFTIFSYQPAWPLLFIGLFTKMLSSTSRASDILKNHPNRDELKENSSTFIIAIAIVFGIFLLNFIIVKYGYNSQRLSSNIDWNAKLKYVIDDLFPLTIYPWLYIWFPGQFWLKMLSWITFIISIITILFVLFRSIYWTRGTAAHVSLTEYLFILSIATSIIPLTLGMFIFTDQGIAFRRVLYASMVFWFTFLFAVVNLSHPAVNIKFARILNGCVLNILILYTLGFGYFLNISTVQLASREWNTAVCASKQVSLKQSPSNEPTWINTEIAILPISIPSALSSDEFQVRTFSYPTGGMLAWLAEWEAHNSLPAVSRWNIGLKGSPNLSEWDSAFLKCLTQN